MIVTKRAFTLILLLLSLLINPVGAMAIDFDFHEMIDGVKKLRELYSFSNGKFIQGGLFAGAGAGIDQQLAIAALGPKGNKTLAAYCIGGQTVSTSAGVGVMAQTGQTLGCKDIDAYSGGFLSISIGGQFILGASVSYSFGIDVHKMIGHLAEHRINSTEEDRLKLREQLSQLMSFVVENNIPNTGMGHLIAILKRVSPLLVIDQVYDLAIGTFSESVDQQTFAIENSATYPSFGKRIRQLSTRLEREYLNRQLEAPKYALNFVDGIAKFFTGCDSIGGGADIGISAGVGASVQISSYKLLAKLPYKYLRKLSPSPFEKIPDVGYRESLMEIGRFLKKIAKDSYRCSGSAQADTIGYIGHIKRYHQGKNY